MSDALVLTKSGEVIGGKIYVTKSVTIAWIAGQNLAVIFGSQPLFQHQDR
jgi:hypothetical protein